MEEALARLAKKGVSCGCYWVPDKGGFLDKAKAYLQRAGFKHSILGTNKDASIKLPSFER